MLVVIIMIHIELLITTLSTHDSLLNLAAVATRNKMYEFFKNLSWSISEHVNYFLFLFWFGFIHCRQYYWAYNIRLAIIASNVIGMPCHIIMLSYQVQDLTTIWLPKVWKKNDLGMNKYHINMIKCYYKYRF